MFSNLGLGSLCMHIINVHFVCISLDNLDPRASSLQNLKKVLLCNSKLLVNDRLDVNKDRSNRPSPSTSKLLERKCTEIKVHSYKQYM